MKLTSARGQGLPPLEPSEPPKPPCPAPSAGGSPDPAVDARHRTGSAQGRASQGRPGKAAAGRAWHSQPAAAPPCRPRAISLPASLTWL